MTFLVKKVSVILKFRLEVINAFISYKIIVLNFNILLLIMKELNIRFLYDSKFSALIKLCSFYHVYNFCKTKHAQKKWLSQPKIMIIFLINTFSYDNRKMNISLRSYNQSYGYNNRTVFISKKMYWWATFDCGTYIYNLFFIFLKILFLKILFKLSYIYYMKKNTIFI